MNAEGIDAHASVADEEGKTAKKPKTELEVEEGSDEGKMDGKIDDDAAIVDQEAKTAKKPKTESEVEEGSDKGKMDGKIDDDAAIVDEEVKKHETEMEVEERNMNVLSDRGMHVDRHASDADAEVIEIDVNQSDADAEKIKGNRTDETKMKGDVRESDKHDGKKDETEMPDYEHESDGDGHMVEIKNPDKSDKEDTKSDSVNDDEYLSDAQMLRKVVRLSFFEPLSSSLSSAVEVNGGTENSSCNAQYDPFKVDSYLVAKKTSWSWNTSPHCDDESNEEVLEPVQTIQRRSK